MNTDAETQTVKSMYQLSRAELLSNATVPAEEFTFWIIYVLT